MTLKRLLKVITDYDQYLKLHMNDDLLESSFVSSIETFKEESLFYKYRNFKVSKVWVDIEGNLNIRINEDSLD